MEERAARWLLLYVKKKQSVCACAEVNAGVIISTTPTLYPNTSITAKNSKNGD